MNILIQYSFEYFNNANLTDLLLIQYSSLLFLSMPLAGNFKRDHFKDILIDVGKDGMLMMILALFRSYE
jgi:hypothetical protein